MKLKVLFYLLIGGTFIGTTYLLVGKPPATENGQQSSCSGTGAPAAAA
ncbi:hypothetical protein MSUIS_05410 [Mycoplasma suis KI3806]|uniref:Uncharacterized protein n=1 Tax=Mycoplasma suis (strain KI_3806) TaxID=708248 RepID=F0V1V3_MYCS3|nr:hypothetical protein MSUIS_05410 [Mycoplasma suis KI3806]